MYDYLSLNVWLHYSRNNSKKKNKGEVVVSLTKFLMIQLDAPNVSFLVEKSCTVKKKSVSVVNDYQQSQVKNCKVQYVKD